MKHQKINILWGPCYLGTVENNLLIKCYNFEYISSINAVILINICSYKQAFIDHKGLSKGDFLFGESEFEPMTMDYTPSYMHNIMNNENDWTLSKEAFPLRHEIKDRSPPPEQFPNHLTDINEDCASLMIEDQPSQLIVTHVPKPQFWDPTNLIEEALKHHAALRDIQTSASILIALGEKRKNLNIEIAVQEHWILEYLDMLARFKLWNVATQVSG